MNTQLRSELRKMRTTRTNLGLVLSLVGLILFGVVAGGFSSESDLSIVGNQRDLVGNGAFAALFAALIGVLAMTSEFRHGTIAATFVFTPARTVVVLAKVLASLTVGAAFGVVGSLLSLGAGAILIRSRGYEVLLGSADVRRLVVGTIVMSALWAALGVGLGALVRNQIVATVGLFAWVFVVESVFLEYLPGLGRYGPAAAGTAMTGSAVGDASVDLLPSAAGGAVLAAYAVALVAAGVVAVSRRDVA